MKTTQLATDLFVIALATGIMLVHAWMFPFAIEPEPEQEDESCETIS